MLTAQQSELQERARKAVSVFRAMQPGLTGYVRALTGNQKMTVKIAEQGGYTDGKDIYVKPPIALGDMTPHERRLCDRRDPDTLLQQCNACRLREEVLSMVYHEIAHNAFGTFVAPTESAKLFAIERAIAELGTKFADQAKAYIENLPFKSYMNVVAVVSEFLPVLINALEDARVDASMFEARKGTRVMFDARVRYVFANGYEEADGTRTKWSERKLNSQAIIGVYVLACGYKSEGWFHPLVEEALKDEELIKLAETAPRSKTAHDTYYLGFKVLARLRALGFCLNENEPQDESEDEDEEEQGVPQLDLSGEEGDPADEAGPEASSGGHGGSSEGPGDGDGEAVPSNQDEQGDGAGAPDEAGEPLQGPDEASDGDAADDAEGDDRGGAAPDEAGAAGRGSDNEPEDSDGSEDEGVEVATGDELSDGEATDSGREDRQGRSDDEDFSEQDAGGDDSTGDHSEPAGGPESDDLGGIEAVDSGADEGRGGVAAEVPEYGVADDAKEDLQVFTQHDEAGNPGAVIAPESHAEQDAVSVAVIQGVYFETGSANIRGVRESKYGKTREDGSAPEAWPGTSSYGAAYRVRSGTEVDLDIPESVLGPALLEMRRVFADNERATMERHLRSGRVNQRVLGKRAWVGDERLFQKKRMPGKKSYSVLLGIDISYSTVGRNIALAKRAAMAQAELLSRAGIEFAVYAHSANDYSGSWSQMWLDVYEVKGFDAPWGAVEQKALSELQPVAENLDGHTIEYYRKTIEKRSSTDKIILYYSDGKMPAANHDEELEILEREIKTCKRKDITLMGVGIRTDSPRRHGLDTVQVEDDSDIVQVIRHLKNALVRSR